eukprot:scaffold26800_cov127-Cylindrotheca_fusiformis.AAC.6
MKRSGKEFMDSYRAAVSSEQTEEPLIPEKTVESSSSDDPLGEEISRILNQNSSFQSLSRQETSAEESCMFRPLLSSRNWKVVKPRLIKVLKEFTTCPRQKLQTIIQKQWDFFFWNTKPKGVAGLLFMVLLAISFVTSATVVTVSTIWCLKSVGIIITIAVSGLFDIHELKDMVPKRLSGGVSTLLSIFQWIDRYILLGIQFAGREWNKNDFEWNDGKCAESACTRLWSLPPPSAREKSMPLCCEEEQLKRESWSADTTQHSASINYCYNMMRESFVRNKYSKLRKAVPAKVDKLGPVVSKTESDGHTIAYTSELNTPRNAAATPRVQNLSINTSSFPESDDDDDNFEESMGALQLKSPTDAVEIIRKLDLFHSNSHDTIPEVRTDESMSHDGIDAMLNDEDISFLQTTERNRRDGPEVADPNKEADMKWMDVGAEIGLKLLGSAAVQKAMTSHDTAERINTIKENFAAGRKTPDRGRQRQTTNSSDKEAEMKALSHPVHSMWTSASSAAVMKGVISPVSSIDSSEEIVNDEGSSMVQLEGDHTANPLFCEASVSESCSNAYGEELAPATAHPLNDETADRGAIKDSHLTRSRSLTPQRTISRKNTPLTPKTPKRSSVGKRSRLLPGVKIVVPLFPLQPDFKPSRQLLQSSYQMATVVSSTRLYVGNKKKRNSNGNFETNCLSVTVKLDKSFLRGGEFAELTFRVMDEWGDRYMPKHSKLPVGSCVATSFGLGVLVGWRVEDDCHVVRSLWQRRGSGSVSAYLNRDSIHSTVPAAVGFKVKTTHGTGVVVAYKNGGKDFQSGKYFVRMSERGNKLYGQSIEIAHSEVVSCPSAQFIPVIEHIREAAKYRLQLFDYKESLEASNRNVKNDPLALESVAWQNVSKWSDMVWKSFLRAIEEDDDFDEGMNEFISTMVSFLDKLDTSHSGDDSSSEDNLVVTASNSMDANSTDVSESETMENNWVFNVFGIFGSHDSSESAASESIEVEWIPTDPDQSKSVQKSYKRIYGVIRTMLRTIALTRAACVDEPDFKLALSICHEVLLFVKTVIRVQQRNTNPYSIKVWHRALEEIASTFGPAKERLERIWKGIAERMERQGKRAKVRLLRFVDIIVQDDVLLMSVEQGDWSRCCINLELALVKAQIIDEENREHYHRTAKFLFDHFANVSSRSGSAGARNNEKMAQFGRFVQWLASPKRSILRLFLEDSTLSTIERLLVGVFQDEAGAARMLSIHAQNFHTLRQFRMLKDFTVAGQKFWMPLLDAADAELSLIVSRMPEGTKEYVDPLSKLFSLCIVEFHKMSDGDLTNHWLDFFMEDEAISIIHDIDMKLILALESFSRDVKEMMVSLPYYASIEDDILNLVDEVDVDSFLREAASSLDDPDKLSDFIREKATIGIERFLDYLPKMSIPVEKRDLADGWVLTCRGEDGGDLTLTDLVVKRENLVCQVLGGDSIFFPKLGSDEGNEVVERRATESTPKSQGKAAPESSILDHIREMILQAKRYGCWRVGVGGISEPPSDSNAASVLQGLPISRVLDSAIGLWRNLEIDDDELLEIAVKDVSYQIRINEGGKNKVDEGRPSDTLGHETESKDISTISNTRDLIATATSTESLGQRYNPRIDPTVLYLEIKMLTFHLEHFFFRIEKHESKRTIFDPVFEGCGNLLVRNVSIKLRVECVRTQSTGSKASIPILQLSELDVQLEKVKLKVKDTGADWLLNKVVEGFADNITQIVAANLNDQVREQVELILENLNSYFEVDPDVVLGLLGISMDDLDEQVAWV